MTPDELSPRRLAEIVEPELAFDAALFEQCRLSDMYRHETRDVVCVVFDDEGKTVCVEVAPSGSDVAAVVQAAGLDFSWVEPSPSDVGIRACRKLAALVTKKLGYALREWQLGSDMPLALEREFAPEPTPFASDPDSRKLERDAAQYQKLYGSKPQGVRLGPNATGLSIHYPHPNNGFQSPSGAVYEMPIRFSTRRAFRRHLATLGCALERGEIRTVPTPTTYNEGRRRVAPDGCPVRVGFGRPKFGFDPAGPWVRHLLLENLLSVGIAPGWAIGMNRALRRIKPFSSVPIDAGILVHDVSVHAVAFHAIPATEWWEMRDHAARRLGQGANALRVARFFEEKLTLTSWDIWKTLEHPREFAPAFEREYADLRRALSAL